ncbi:MAG: SDR family oxidoreductase [Pseudomonadales bacterium]|nr:SDR family oxidoreductase [Pseudomonadales bacterium]MCP5185932.1 SDR family oxidoreductase [Pseudomonadales bacterium]
MTLRDRRVLVTGGARGIGRGIARACLQAGARVMIADLPAREEAWKYQLAGSAELANTVAELSALGDVASATVDVTDADSCADAVAAMVARFGGLDVLVNNAGIVGSGPVETFDEAQWDRIFAVNTKGIFLMTRAALGELRKSSSACVVNTASIAGKKGFPNMSAYCGSKFAAIGITQAMAGEFAADGIRVNAICPGFVGTAMWLEHLLPTNATDNTGKDADFNALMATMVPLKRPQTAEDMGQAVVYLASAPNVTGIALSVAGGFEMN